MATPCFYHPSLSEQDEIISLSSQESAHLAKSRRLTAGQQINLINGHGLLAHAVVLNHQHKEVEVCCDDFIRHPERLRKITIATAIPKGDRVKTMIDMLTQLGVSRIIPLRCEHSVTRFREQNLAKWQRIIVQACKQSQNPWLPSIESESEFSHLLSNIQLQNRPSNRIFYAHASCNNMPSITDLKGEMTVIIGPEGGFSEQELLALTSSSANPMNLGAYILRTELAAVAAMSRLA